MKQSAVEWLVNVVQSCIAPNFIPKEIVEQAKEMEKEQQGYSEKEVKKILFEWEMYKVSTNFTVGEVMDYEQWLEQFKKK